MGFQVKIVPQTGFVSYFMLPESVDTGKLILKEHSLTVLVLPKALSEFRPGDQLGPGPVLRRGQRRPCRSDERDLHSDPMMDSDGEGSQGPRRCHYYEWHLRRGDLPLFRSRCSATSLARRLRVVGRWLKFSSRRSSCHRPGLPVTMIMSRCVWSRRYCVVSTPWRCSDLEASWEPPRRHHAAWLTPQAPGMISGLRLRPFSELLFLAVKVEAGAESLGPYTIVPDKR